MLGCVLALAMIREEPARVTLWESGITVGNLARRLSVGKVRVKADPSIADRLVTIYATDQPAQEVGRQTADALGLKWRKRSFHWVLEPDTEYERMIASHELELRHEARVSFNQLVEHLRKIPPTYPPQARTFSGISLSHPAFASRESPLKVRKERWRHYNVVMSSLYGDRARRWILANSPLQELEYLRDGGVVVGACPGVPGAKPLPGKPTDYIMGSEQAPWVIVFLRWDEFSGSFRSEWTTSRSFGRTTDYLPSFSSPYNAGKTWTKLWDYIEKWKEGGPSNFSFDEWRPKKRTYFSILENIARSTDRPVVSESSPYFGYGGGMVFCSAQRESGHWLLFKPTEFWQLDRWWSKQRDLQSTGEPNIADVSASIDWAAKLCLKVKGWSMLLAEEPAVQRNRHQLGDGYRFAELWVSLSDVEKRSALGDGLHRARLSPAKKKLFDECLFENMFQPGPKPYVAEFLDPAHRASSILKLSHSPRWGHETDSGYSMASKPNPDLGRSYPPPRSVWPIEGHQIDVHFSLEGGGRLSRYFFVSKRGEMLGRED